jgi:hypothetical protein
VSFSEFSIPRSTQRCNWSRAFRLTVPRKFDSFDCSVAIAKKLLDDEQTY